MLTGTGDCFPSVVGLVKALFQTDDIDARSREVVTFRAAVLLNAPYEWQQNAKNGAEHRLSQGEIDTVAADGPVQGLAPDHILGCAATDERVREGTLTDETLSSLLDRYGEVGTRKLILAIGYSKLLVRGLIVSALTVQLQGCLLQAAAHLFPVSRHRSAPCQWLTIRL